MNLARMSITICNLKNEYFLEIVCALSEVPICSRAIVHYQYFTPKKFVQSDIEKPSDNPDLYHNGYKFHGANCSITMLISVEKSRIATVYAG